MSVLLPSSTDPAVAMRRRSTFRSTPPSCGLPIAASAVRSSARVAPRSEIGVAMVSAMTASGVAAVEATAAVDVMSPTVRNRTLRTTTDSSRRGCITGDSAISIPSRSNTSRW